VVGGVLVLTSGLAAAMASRPAVSPLRGGAFEASGALFLPGWDGVLFVDDGRPAEVLWLPLSPDGTQRGAVQPIPMGVSVADPEGITSDGTWVYVAGSLSRGKGASLARFRFDPTLRQATAGEAMSGLEEILERDVPELRPRAGARKGRSQVNVEGLAWDPAQKRLLLGLRSPVVDGKALIVPLRMPEAGSALTADSVAVSGPALRVPLTGSGIRGFEYDPAQSTFQIIAGHPSGAGDFRLVTWAGPDDTVHEQIRFSGPDKPEGVASGTLGGRRVTVLLFDNSGFAVWP
jgi:hypothetical protein